MRRFQRHRILGILGLVVVLAAVAVQAEGQEKPCLECHEGFKKSLSKKFLHEPFDKEQCDACHVFHGFRNRAELAGPVLDLCADCHSEIVELPEEDIHYPVIEDESCTTCHAPHASELESLLRAESGTLCLECHDGPEEAEQVVHPPFAELACITCHSPHGSLFGEQFLTPIGYLCASCHDEVVAGQDPSQMHAASGLDSCNLCHFGHSSENRKLLQAEPQELCFGCHATIRDRLALDYPHAAGEECLDCHNPHLRFTKEERASVCGDCHDVTIEELGAAHAGQLPVDCVGCHDPHGSTDIKLLKEFLHSPFEDRECDICHDGSSVDELRSVDLCLGCHDSPLGEGSHSESALRDARCVDCHSPHASSREALLLKGR